MHSKILSLHKGNMRLSKPTILQTTFSQTMSAQHHGTKTARISPTLSTEKERYYFVTPSTNTNVAFSDLLARESGNYESVREFERVPRSSAQYSCERCYREIGNRPFCYKCFGPPGMPLARNPKRNAWKVVLWIFIGVVIPAMVFTCFFMCIMHLSKIGLYRDDDVDQLKKDMKIALTEIRFLSSYTDGFTNTLNRNMSQILTNIAKIKTQVVKNKSIWPKQIGNIQEIFNASCEQYLKAHNNNNTKISNICHLVFNGTYFK